MQEVPAFMSFAPSKKGKLTKTESTESPDVPVVTDSSSSASSLASPDSSAAASSSVSSASSSTPPTEGRDGRATHSENEAILRSQRRSTTPRIGYKKFWKMYNAFKEPYANVNSALLPPASNESGNSVALDTSVTIAAATAASAALVSGKKNSKSPRTKSSSPMNTASVYAKSVVSAAGTKYVFHFYDFVAFEQKSLPVRQLHRQMLAPKVAKIPLLCPRKKLLWLLLVLFYFRLLLNFINNRAFFQAAAVAAANAAKRAACIPPPASLTSPISVAAPSSLSSPALAAAAHTALKRVSQVMSVQPHLSLPPPLVPQIVKEESAASSDASASTELHSNFDVSG